MLPSQDSGLTSTAFERTEKRGSKARHRAGKAHSPDRASRAADIPEDKRAAAAAINRLVAEALDIAPDDIFIALVPVPNENFSFDKGELQLAGEAPRR
ncbi:tautomerase family protein [Streptomyces sp. NPDC006012]|uniref:tautomerase family protein n=1 Tax=Streptomyces sp. NPDC006012 TaxID=3364739 RepID=UPI003697EAAC